METWRPGQKTILSTVGIAAAMLLFAAFAEEATATGLSLFRHIANSYLVMFIDSLSVGFICF